MSCRPTHAPTHRTKSASGRGGFMSSKEHIVLDAKVLNITQNDMFFIFKAVGKDEVGSSNLPSSSTKHPDSGCFSHFPRCLRGFCVVRFCRWEHLGTQRGFRLSPEAPLFLPRNQSSILKRSVKLIKNAEMYGDAQNAQALGLGTVGTAGTGFLTLGTAHPATEQ